MTGVQKIKIKRYKGRRAPWLAWHTNCALNLPPGECTAWATSTHAHALSWADRHIRIHELVGR